MSVHLFTVSFVSESALPRDSIVNTFYFEGGGADMENVGDMLFDFYNEQPADASFSISEAMSLGAVTGDITIKGYDLADPIPRAALYESNRTLLGIGSGDALPTEVALCLSYRGELESGVPAARRRGRIYLGGLQAGYNVNGRPVGTLTENVAMAARDLLVAANSAVGWEWVQYSQTLEVGSPVEAGFVDNSWDTQRRRGFDATTRVTWTATTPTP